MCNFKVGDIVKSNENIIFKIDEICYCGLEVFGKKLMSNEQIHYGSDEIKKVTFYEMLDYIKDRYIRLTINKPNWDILNCLIDFTSGVTKGISYTYDASEDSVTLYYYVNFFSSNLYIDFDNLDFEKDLKEIELKKKINEGLSIVEDNLKDAFKKSIVYGEEFTVSDFLTKCCNSYIDLISNDNKKVEINMTKEKELKDKLDRVDYWYDKLKEMLNKIDKLEPKEDEVFVNNKKKTTVIKWKDGSMTKATCDKDDKYDLEKGVMVAMLKKYYTVDEINSFIEKAKESNKIDLNKTKNKLKKKQVK